MKKILIFGLILSMVLGMSTVAYATEFKGASTWAIAMLEQASKDGFITEVVSEDFSQNITREEFCEIAVILYDRLGGRQDLEKTNPFTDTTNANVIKACNACIVSGVGNNKFAPEASLTREQLCVMTINAMDAANLVFEEANQYEFQKTYADEKAISTWAYSDVRIMNDFKIINGTGDKLEPLSPLTREQAVVMLEKAYLREFNVEDHVLIEYLGVSSDVVIPSGVVIIGESVFQKNQFIKTVKLPKTVEEIGYAAFRDMPNLTAIDLNEGLKIIGEASFELCNNLQHASLPSTIEQIDFMAFQDCISLTEIIIPSAVSKIDDQAFYRCENLKTVIFEGDVGSISDSAFAECHDLTFVCESGSNVATYALEHGFKVSQK